MIIAEKALGKIKDTNTAGLSVEWVLLDHEAMSRPHQKLKTDRGTSLAVSLSHGDHMHPGDILYMDSEKAIAVDLVDEDALEIHPSGNLQWAKAAFNIGNMHHPAYILPDSIVVPYSQAIENIMAGIGVVCERCNRKLSGEKAAYAMGGHSHDGHDHNHSHDHSHDGHNYNHSHNHDHTHSHE